MTRCGYPPFSATTVEAVFRDVIAGGKDGKPVMVKGEFTAYGVKWSTLYRIKLRHCNG